MYERLVTEFAERPDVTLGGGKRGFGSNALQYRGRIFSIIRPADLVLKLPQHRVAQLIGAGRGVPFDAGKGRPMREWVAISAGSDGECRNLLEEALQFVAGAAVC